MTKQAPKKLLKRPEVRARTTLSDSALYRLMETGDFPRPIQLVPGGRSVAWVESEVEDWIEKRIQETQRQGDQ